MDLNTIADVVASPDRSAQAAWRQGDAWLGGGTWLFSEPQPELSRLIDLDGFRWPAIECDASGLTLGATCKIAELKGWAGATSWPVGRLVDQCCHALLGSFKVWNMATVGGNICLALPAGPMTSLAAGLGATCLIWLPDGTERHVAAADFVIGDHETVLKPGELLRSIHFPAAVLSVQSAFRRLSLTPHGRSAVLIIGTRGADGEIAITVTASTKRPVRLLFGAAPQAGDVASALDQAIPEALYHDDVHGAPAWRRHLTYQFAEEVRAELLGEGRS